MAEKSRMKLREPEPAKPCESPRQAVPAIEAMATCARIK